MKNQTARSIDRADVNIDGLSEEEGETINPIFGFEVRPHRAIDADDIAQAHDWCAAPFRIGDAIKLGFRLTCWRDLMPSTRAWQAWLAAYLPQLSYDDALTHCRLYETFWDGGQWYRLYDGNASNIKEAFKQIAAARKTMQDEAGCEKHEHTKRRKCAECRSLFVPKRKTAQFCSPKCRVRANRKAERAHRVTLRKNVGCEVASRLDSQTAENTRCGFSDIHSSATLSVTLEGGAL